MQITPDNNSYESIIKKFQKIYQQKNENADNIEQRTNDTVMPQQEANNMVGATPVADSGDIGIQPTVSTTMISITEGTLLPIDINYTYTNDFTLPEKYLGFLGFENYFSVQAPNQISTGFIGQASIFNTGGYKIIADGTTVWKGTKPPIHYLQTLPLSTCVTNATYYSPAWQVIIPSIESGEPEGGPNPGTYEFVGFMVTYDVVRALPNTLGTFYLYNQFWGFNVTNIDSDGNVTASGLLIQVPGKTTLQTLQTQKFGMFPVPPSCTIVAPNVPQYMTTIIWPQAWQNPNNLGVVIPGLSPIIPGQTVEFTGNQYNGDAIYQPPPNLQFITPGSLFIGVTFEASFPSVATFEAAGMIVTEANLAFNQLKTKWFNALGGGTIANAENQTGNGWDVVRVPGDMGLSGISSDGQTIAFSVMWTAYLAGGNPSWFYLGNVSTYGGTNVFPAPNFTYGTTMTFNIANINVIFLSPTGQLPGNEIMFPTIDPNREFYPPMSTTFPGYTNWTYKQNKYRVCYDSAFSCPLFVLGQPDNVNLGRPNQHESMNPIYNLTGGFGSGNPFYNSNIDAGCFYYLPYRTLEIISVPVASEPTNLAILDNTFDPFFIRKSKTTDTNEVWTVCYYYSAVVLSPSIFQEEVTNATVDDTTIYQNTVNSSGYIVNAQEGLSPWTVFGLQGDPVFPDEGKVPIVVGGPARYSISTPDTSTHTTQQVKVYAPDPSDITTRVKVSLKSPVNWLKLNKYDAQEL